MAITDLVNKIILTDEFSKAFDDYNRRLGGAETGTQRFEATLKGLAGVGAVVGGGLLAANAAIDELTDRAAENERAMFNVAFAAAAANKEFGDGVGTVDSWTASVQQTSDRLRIFGDQDVANATARLVDMTKRLGFTEEQMRTVLARTADLSAGKVDLTGGIERVTAALRGEAESAEFLGLSLNEMSVIAYAEAQGLVWKNLTDVEKAQLRYNLLLVQTDALQGRAAASAETIAGQEAELARLRDREIAQLGQSLLPLRQGEIALLQRLAAENLSLGDVVTKTFSAIQAAYVTFGVVAKTIIDDQIGRLGAFRAGWEALRAGDNPITAFTEALKDNADEAQRVFDVLTSVPQIYTDAYNQVLTANQAAGQAQVDLGDAVITTTDAIRAQGGIAAQVAGDITKEWEKAREAQVQQANQYNRQIADLEYEHGQRVARIHQDIARAIAEAAAQAAEAQLAADANLAQGLAEIEANLASDRASAVADFNRSLDALRQDRRDAERQTARDIRAVEEDLQRSLADLARDRAADIAGLESDRADDVADLNSDLADDLADLQYKTEQDRLKIISDFGNQAVKLEQSYADRRKAINDTFEGEFAEADPFRRKILEFNRQEELRQLEDQQAAETSLLNEQQQQALAALQERVTREQEILNREAQQRQDILNREAEQRRVAIETEAAERAEALRLDAEERREALEQRLEQEREQYERRRAELERQLAEERAAQERAAAEARARLVQRHAEELAKIQEQEARKVEQAQQALARENQNYSDRLASLQRSNQIEQSEIEQQLDAIEAARRQSYDRQLNDAEAFMSELRRTLAGAGGSGSSSGGYTSNSITINNNGAPGGFANAAQNARTVQDAIAGF